MKKIITYLPIFLLFTTLMFGCADSVNVKNCLPNDEAAGFWSGTWDGMIMVFSFIGSLFDDDIAIYAINNNGHWYDFGFVGGFFLMIRIFFGTVKKVIE